MLKGNSKAQQIIEYLLLFSAVIIILLAFYGPSGAPRWVLGEWAPAACPVPCGGAVQRRTVECQQGGVIGKFRRAVEYSICIALEQINPGADPRFCDESRLSSNAPCLGSPPPDTRICNPQPCAGPCNNNGLCDPGETNATCPGDCPPLCGDAMFDCTGQCGICAACSPCCGDGNCDFVIPVLETCSNCSIDCGSCCVPKTVCSPGDCGIIQDGCNTGTIDCGPCAGSVCPNNVKESGEVCDDDGTDGDGLINGKDCADLGYAGGVLACLPDCSNYDPGACAGVPPDCRNNVCDPLEDCSNCPSDCGCCIYKCDARDCGRSIPDGCGGMIDCGPCCVPKTICAPGDCGIIRDGCNTGTIDCGPCAGTVCPNNVKESGEVCDDDGTDGDGLINGKNCFSFGYGSGTLACQADCKNYDFANCSNVPADCGNNACDAGEDCGICPTDCGCCLLECGPGDCGFIDDMCNGTISCETQCCVPKTVCSPGDCGIIQDGCNTGTIDCGPCAGSVCPNNVKESGEVCDDDGTDGDGLINGKDCADLGYAGGTLACLPDCSNYDPGACSGVPPDCRNNVCDPLEDCSNCPSDCGCCMLQCGPFDCNIIPDGCGDVLDCGVCCVPAVCGPDDCDFIPDGCGRGGQIFCGQCWCGNASCDPGENCDDCGQDCGACFCGNGRCDSGENCDDCGQDCGACFCGNGRCDSGENCDDCGQDCGACFCGNGRCDSNEDATCPDCPPGNWNFFQICNSGPGGNCPAPLPSDCSVPLVNPCFPQGNRCATTWLPWLPQWKIIYECR